MSGDHNMYCSGNQPDIVERLRETSAEIVKDTLPRWKNLDEYMDEAADEIVRLQKELKTERVLSFRNEVRRLEEQLAEITAERNRVWWREHWTEYEHSIASMECEACIDCIKAFSTDGDRSEEMIAAILRRMARRTWPKDAEQKVQEIRTDVHSCSYYCDRPECIKAQRDELRERLALTRREMDRENGI